MWFRFPEGTEQISVQQQVFVPEYRDAKGANFFRAPDHFAPIILSQTDCLAIRPEGEDVPTDMPSTLGVRGDAVDDMASLNAQQSARIAELERLCQDSANELLEKNERIAALEKQLADLQPSDSANPAQPQNGGSKK